MNTKPCSNSAELGKVYNERVKNPLHDWTALASTKVCTKDGAGTSIVCTTGQLFKANSRCSTHYQQWWRKQPKCKFPRCKAIQARKHGYCRLHEGQALTTRPDKAREKTLARYRRGIRPDWETGCWLWQEQPNEDGYGMLWVGNAGWYAHRFGYVYFYGGHKPKRVLDHICNQKLCVRPDHMWPVTNTLNIKLREERAFGGALAYWRDAEGLPESIRLGLWAFENQLPFGKEAPFGKDGTIEDVRGMGRLRMPPSEARLQHKTPPAGAVASK